MSSEKKVEGDYQLSGLEEATGVITSPGLLLSKAIRAKRHTKAVDKGTDLTMIIRKTKSTQRRGKVRKTLKMWVVDFSCKTLCRASYRRLTDST